MNIVEMAMRYLTPMLVDRIASSLGIQSPMVRTAIAAILPSILAGITGVATKPGGAGRITDVLGKQNTDILGDLGSIFGGSGQNEAVKQGTDTLRDLLGGSSVQGLTGAVGKFTGAGESSVQSLVGMLAPVALGTLAKQQQDAGLDASGLADMLAGQKENIRAAMPEGFADHLAGTGLLDAVTPAPAPESRPAPRPEAQSGGMGMMPMLLAAGALALGGYYFLGGPSEPVNKQAPGAGVVASGDFDPATALGKFAGNVKTTLGTISDEASAKTALPLLQQYSQALDGFRSQGEKMPAAGKTAFATAAGEALKQLKPLIDKILAIPGASSVVKPMLDQIVAKLDAMGKG